jgi:hypothetical protein
MRKKARKEELRRDQPELLKLLVLEMKIVTED